MEQAHAAGVKLIMLFVYSGRGRSPRTKSIPKGMRSTCFFLGHKLTELATLRCSSNNKRNSSPDFVNFTLVYRLGKAGLVSHCVKRKVVIP